MTGNRYAKHWFAFGVVVVASFVVLGYYGRELYREAPPIPKRIVTPESGVVFTGQQIRDGQNVWQSMGGQEVGTVWGHGAYVAPDWSADWLHREAGGLLNRWAGREHGRSSAELPPDVQASLGERLKRELRTNTYDPASGDLIVSADRAAVMEEVGGHYAALFGDERSLAALRDAYAIPANSIKDPQRQEALNAFFFWASWACVTNRPGSTISYTNNWPPEELVGNRPTGSIVVWSVISFVLLLAGIGARAWYFAVQRKGEDETNGVPPAPAMVE